MFFLTESGPREVKATLEEIVYSKLIVHVIDVSDEYSFHKANVVYEVLESIDSSIDIKNRVIEVHNKIDLLDNYNPKPFNELVSKNNVFQTSAKKSFGVKELKLGIENLLFDDFFNEKMFVSPTEKDKLNWLYSRQLVTSAEQVGKNIKVIIRWNKIQKEQFKKSFLVLV